MPQRLPDEAMRFLIATTFLVSLVGCVPTVRDHSAVVPVPIAQSPAVPSSRLQTAPSPPATLLEAPRLVTREISGIHFEGVAFDSRGHRLAVVDQPTGPGTLFTDAAALGHARGALAAVNAGFFTPEGKPLGLVISSGKISGSWNRVSSLGSGVWYENRNGNTAITRRETIGRVAAASERELIQAGPLLVENGHEVSGLESTKNSVRTVLLWDGGTRWWIGRSSSCTLAALAQTIVGGHPTTWSVRQALNLDGGRSADLWISGALAGGPITRRSPWNRSVRNFLVLIPR